MNNSCRLLRRPGFTLIELLVVIFIISLLVAVTLVVIPKVKRAVYGAETQAQLSALANAIQQYYNDYKSYPGPLPNNQLNWQFDSVPGNQPNAYTFQLAGSAPPYPAGSPYNPSTATTFGNNITGAQNLVLGLLGGLELTTASGAPNGFVYNPQDIFSDGITPAPRGAASLNFSNPKRQQVYIQVKAGELSTPANNLGVSQNISASFQDEATRTPQDAMIPVFLDKYSNPLPILYYRTNVGGTAIAGFRNKSGLTQTPPGNYVDDKGNVLQDLTLAAVGGGSAETAQFDLDDNLPYTTSKIGTLANLPNSYHGLIGITLTSGPHNNYNNSNPPYPMLLITNYPEVDSIDNSIGGEWVPSNNGYNALAYFKDPSLNSTTYDGTTGNTHMGTARQKDGFILISAGPDRLYGTHDDNIYPGPLQP